MQTIQELLNTVSRELTDEGPLRRWTQDDLVKYYNSAVAALATYRPDIFATTKTVTCVAGTRQTLPTGARRLIEVERNTNGRKLRFCELGVLDDMEPDWMCSTGSTEAEAYAYDESNPTVFWLYPGVADGVQVDVVASVTPEPVTVSQITQPLPFDAAFFTPCMDWIIYRAYMRDADDTANSARGQLHLQAFAQYLGIKLEADRALSQRRQQKFQTNQG